MKFDLSQQKTEVDKLAAVLIHAWEKAEGKEVNASYVATFADMARAVVEYQKAHPPAGLTRLSIYELEQLDP